MKNSNDSGSAMTATDMPKPTLTTPVLFLIFNRPDTTAIVFEAIRAARPPRLYVAADGARANRPAEAIKCRETRAIIEQVDWPCDVRTLYRDENLGCKRAVSSAITWFFENEPCGIILEDDCLPNASFFAYCQILLETFAEDERIGMISGTTFFASEVFSSTQEHYAFTKFGSIWGWATWRRAWAKYDVSLENWNEMKQPRTSKSALPIANQREAYFRFGDSIVSGRLDTWDYQWSLAQAYHSMLTVTPTRNLIINIGFGPDATHTTFQMKSAPVTAPEMTFPLRAPKFIIPDHDYDTRMAARFFPSYFSRKLNSITSRLSDRRYLIRMLKRITG